MPESQQQPSSGVAAASAGRGGSTGYKLRDSCQACATGKVKCPKQKPTCSRCETRGIKCEYFISHRPGRKRESRKSKDSTSTGTSTSTSTASTISSVQYQSDGGGTIQVGRASGSGTTTPNTDTASTSRSNSTSYLTTPAPSIINQASPIHEHTSANDSLDFISRLEEADLSSVLVDFNFPAHGIDLFMLDNDDSLFEMPMLDTSVITHTAHNDVASLLMPSRSSISHGLGRVPEPSSTTSTTTTVDLPSANQLSKTASTASVSSVSTPSCDCVLQSIDLLKKLVSAESGTLGTSRTDDTYTQEVLMKNKQNLQLVNTLLECACANDSFALTIYSLIIIKILGSYAAASRATEDRGQIALLGSTRHACDESRTRKTAQRVFGELHHVQRLVNHLAPRLKGLNDESKRQQRSWQIMEDMDKMIPKTTTVAAFSAGTMEHVEADIRNNLKTLSGDIMHTLRQS